MISGNKFKEWHYLPPAGFKARFKTTKTYIRTTFAQTIPKYVSKKSYIYTIIESHLY